MVFAKHIIWDWNGTLINDAPLAVDVINEIRADLGLTAIGIDFFRDIYQHPIIAMYRAMGFPNINEEEFGSLSKLWNARYAARFSEVLLHDDAQPVLQILSEKVSAQHVLSAHHHDSLIENIRDHKLSPYFKIVSGLNNRKADSKIENAWRMINDLAVPAEQVMIIGDSSHDYEVAAELKCSCVLMAHGAESSERLLRHGVPVMENFTELQKFLKLS